MVALLRMPSFLESAGPKLATSHERRMFERRETSLHAQAKRLDHSINALRMPMLSFPLRDLSLGGCSALTDIPLSAGERLTVSIPQNGHSLPWNAFARVIRCQPSSLGYRVAVEFDPLPAA